MRIAVKAHAWQKEEWLSKQTPGNAGVVWVETGIPEADAYFDLTFEEFGAAFVGITNKPVFINAVIQTSDELPANSSRINSWNGFLKRDIVEVVTTGEAAKQVLDGLGWKYQQAPDVPGMITARIISMIINEAYFAFADNVSPTEEIDIAMKLGTNYPFGPFEWSRRIGLHNVYRLLRKLSETDARYLPSPALEQELKTVA
jgi:3-hydroxybutyryl-CoA dehydrogenase